MYQGVKGDLELVDSREQPIVFFYAARQYWAHKRQRF